WQAEQSTGFDLSHFVIDWEREIITCPEGKQSSKWKPTRDTRGNEILQAAFLKSECSVCPSLTKCTAAKIQRRMVHIKPRALHEGVERARGRERSEEFKEAYKQRAGVEGTISQAIRAFGMRRSRYIGLAKTRLQHLAIAAAVNLARVYAWFTGETPETTRKS